MKKLLLSLITVLALLIALPVSAKDEQVPVYMFSKDGCPACVAAQEYFEELETEYPELFELVEIVVFDGNWNAVSEERQMLLLSVYEEFGEDTSSAATPTIVIGDYYTIGLPKDTNEVYKAIENVRDSKEKIDVVKELVEEAELDLEDLEKYDANNNNQNTSNTNESTDGKYDTIIIIGIFAVLIGGFAGLVILGKK